MFGYEEQRPQRYSWQGGNPALPRSKSVVYSWADPRRGGQASSGIQRRHAVFLAGRHVVDGVESPVALAGSRTKTRRRPEGKGFYGHSNRCGTLSRHVSVRPARRERGRLSMGDELHEHQPEIFRRGGQAVVVSRRPGLHSVHRGRVGLFHAVDGRRENEAALALLDRALRGGAGRVVRGGRGEPAVVSREEFS